MAAFRLALVVFSASLSPFSASSTADQREHEPAWCQPKLDGYGGSTRKVDVEKRNDECCAAKGDFLCGGGRVAEESRQGCSKQVSKVKLYEFKCYPDEDEFPLGVLIAVVCAVGLGCVFVSMAFFKYNRFVAAELTEERAIFTKRDSKVLTRSNTGSDSIANFARLSRSGSKSESSQTSQGFASGLPNLFQQQGDDASKGQAVSKPQQEGTGLESMDFVVTFSTESDENSVTCI